MYSIFMKLMLSQHGGFLAEFYLFSHFFMRLLDWLFQFDVAFEHEPALELILDPYLNLSLSPLGGLGFYFS